MIQKYRNLDAEESTFKKTVQTVQNSFWLKLSIIGFGLIISGYFIQLAEVAWTITEVWAVIFAIWGSALIIAGIGTYAAVWWSYQ